jgi:hypothetical protein
MFLLAFVSLQRTRWSRHGFLPEDTAKAELSTLLATTRG